MTTAHAGAPAGHEPLTDREQYQLLFEESPCALLSIGPEGRITAVNRASVRLLAQSRAELRGTALLELVLPGDRARVRQRMQGCIQGDVITDSARVVRGDGAPRTFRYHAVPVLGPGGLERVDLFLQDVTATPFTSHDDPALYSLLENVPDQFALLLDPHGRIRRALGLARTLWVNDTDAIGRSYTLLLAADEVNRNALAELQARAETGTGWSAVVWHVRADGTRVPVRVFAMSYRDPRSETLRGMLLVGRDASAEEELVQRADRADRQAAVGELVGSVAAELSRALDDALGAVRIDLRIARLRHLLDSLATFAATSLSPTGERTDVPAAVREVVRDAAADAPDTEILVESADDVATIPADAAHVRLAVSALLRNALESGSGRVEVRLALTPESGVRVTVRDYGAGIEAAVRDRLGAPFVTTRPGHLGLGLAIVRAIAAIYGGRLQLQPGEGRGTAAVLELPPTRPDASVFRPVPLLIARGRTVLVVDDDQAVRGMLRRVFERVGYRVQEAWSGRSALAALAEHGRPDIILTDIKMEGGSGYWLLNQLRREDPELLERTIVVTGYSEDRQVEQLALSTACPVLRKPLDFRVLIELMNDVLLKSARS